jgi:hypothetical protein
MNASNLTAASLPVTLYPRAVSSWASLIINGVLVAMGVFLIVVGKWIGVVAAAFFSLGLVFAVIQLLPGSCYLRVTKDGLAFCQLYRVRVITWDMVNSFFVFTIKHNGFKANELVAFRWSETVERSSYARWASEVISQCDGALPQTYERKASELAAFLNACLAEYRRRQASATDDDH